MVLPIDRPTVFALAAALCLAWPGVAPSQDGPSLPSIELHVDSALRDFPAAHAFDGNRASNASRWASARTRDRHWIRGMLAAQLQIDAIRITTQEGEWALQDATFEILDDDAIVPLAHWTAADAPRFEAAFAPRSIRSFRLWIEQGCAREGGARIYEIELLRDGQRIAVAATDRARQRAEPVDDSTLLSSWTDLATPPPRDDLDDETHRTLRKSLEAWAAHVEAALQPVPEHGGELFLGRGGHRENDVRPICYAALLFAHLARDSDAGRRSRRLRAARGLLRYLCATHRPEDGHACVDGGHWGRQWQSAMWARSLGLAGWLLGDHLDPELRLAVARVVEIEADRLLAARPKSQRFADTGAEENAWNAQLLGLAACQLADNPRAAAWAEAAKAWTYDVFSVAADHHDTSPGDDGRPIWSWVSTINAHPDFTVENHRLVHVGYLKNSLSLQLEGALPYLLAGRPVPQAHLHHADDVFAVLRACMAWDGAPISFGGNDWKLFHTQASEHLPWCFLNLLAGDHVAAAFEHQALDWLARMQEAHGGYFNQRRDLEYGGLVASRLIAADLAHRRLGPGVAPASFADVDAACSQVRVLEHAKAVLHRTPTKFSSFTWGPACMGLAMPQGGNWAIWPHTESLTGHFEFAPGFRGATLARDFTVEAQADRFRVVGSIERGDGAVIQDIAFVSPADDVAVVIERIEQLEPGALQHWEGGVLGLEYPLGENQVELTGAFGKVQTRGEGGAERAVRTWPGDWLNIAGQLGCAMRSWPAHDNRVRYVDEVSGHGRVPVLQESLALISRADAAPPEAAVSYHAIVLFLGADAAETRRRAQQVEFEVEGTRATIRWDGGEESVDFDASPDKRR